MKESLHTSEKLIGKTTKLMMSEDPPKKKKKKEAPELSRITSDLTKMTFKWNRTTELVTIRYNRDEALKMIKLHQALTNQGPRLIHAHIPKKKPFGYLPCSKDVLQLFKTLFVSQRFLPAYRCLELLASENSHRDHVFYKGTMFLLESSKNRENMDIFVRKAITLPFLNKRLVLLEHLNYLLRNLDFELPSDIFQQLLPLKTRLRKNRVYDPLLTAYASIFIYIHWVKFKSNEDENLDSEMQAKEFITTISKCISTPGQWDIFVLKVQEVLEHYGELDSCVRHFESHLKANQHNLHAYIYFYRFLKKYQLEEKRQLSLLVSITERSPSNILVLDLVEIYRAEEKFNRVPRLIFLFLDYAANKDSLLGWETLSSLSLELLEKFPKTVYLSKLLPQWKERMSYWPQYHFDPERIKVENSDQAAICLAKCTFLVCVKKNESKTISYVKATKEALKENHPEIRKKLKEIVKKIKRLKPRKYRRK